MNLNQPSRRGLLGGFFALVSGLLFAKRTPAATPATLPPLPPATAYAYQSVTPLLPDITTMVYDANATCLARIDPSGLVTTFTYDGRKPE